MYDGSQHFKVFNAVARLPLLNKLQLLGFDQIDISIAELSESSKKVCVSNSNPQGSKKTLLIFLYKCFLSFLLWLVVGLHLQITLS